VSRLTAIAQAAAVGVSALGSAAYWTGFRSRSQIFGSFPHAADTEENVVALSFEDGPNEPYTSRLLDILDAYGVKATFSQVGRCAQRFPSTTRRVVQSGHVLGNHSYSHSFSGYLKQPRQEIEITRSQEVFYSITGVTPALYRPPWLCHWPWVLNSVLQHGLQPVSGTFVHPLEIFQPAAFRAS
jgi:peptidoglycan/xylan/chitin deacetylase (PgdA/CDA1 family)